MINIKNIKQSGMLFFCLIFIFGCSSHSHPIESMTIEELGMSHEASAEEELSNILAKLFIENGEFPVEINLESLNRSSKYQWTKVSLTNNGPQRVLVNFEAEHKDDLSEVFGEFVCSVRKLPRENQANPNLP